MTRPTLHPRYTAPHRLLILVAVLALALVLVAMWTAPVEDRWTPATSGEPTLFQP